MIRELRERNGPLMFHQSGGCCDGSAPMCYPDGDLILGDNDVHLGDLDVGEGDPVAVWMTREQFQAWKHTHITIDLVKGRGAGFSLEAPTGHRFLIRSRLMDSGRRGTRLQYLTGGRGDAPAQNRAVSRRRSSRGCHPWPSSTAMPRGSTLAGLRVCTLTAPPAGSPPTAATTAAGSQTCAPAAPTSRARRGSPTPSRPDGPRILDAGSGMGRIGAALQDRGHDVVGVDLDAAPCWTSPVRYLPAPAGGPGPAGRTRSPQRPGRPRAIRRRST